MRLRRALTSVSTRAMSLRTLGNCEVSWIFSVTACVRSSNKRLRRRCVSTCSSSSLNLWTSLAFMRGSRLSALGFALCALCFVFLHRRAAADEAAADRHLVGHAGQRLLGHVFGNARHFKQHRAGLDASSPVLGLGL